VKAEYKELLRRASARLRIADDMVERGQPGAAGWQRRMADREFTTAGLWFLGVVS